MHLSGTHLNLWFEAIERYGTGGGRLFHQFQIDKAIRRS